MLMDDFKEWCDIFLKYAKWFWSGWFISRVMAAIIFTWFVRILVNVKFNDIPLPVAATYGLINIIILMWFLIMLLLGIGAVVFILGFVFYMFNNPEEDKTNG